MPNHKKFREELKSQLERHLDARHNIDTKSYNMISIAGTIATLLSGFGFALNRIIDPTSYIFSILLLLILFGICCMLIAIIFSIRAYTVRSQTNPIIHTPFYDNNGTGTYDDKIVKEYVNDITEEEFDLSFIESYLNSIKSAATAIEHKSKWLVRTEYAFLAGVSLILVAGIVYGIDHFSLTGKIFDIFNSIISYKI